MTNRVAELKEAALIDSLKKCPMFEGLSQEVLREIVVFTSVVPVDKGETIFHEGDPCKGFYIVQKGIIKVHRMNSVGKEQVIHMFRAGESFAEGALASEAGYPADATAVESSQLLLVRREEFVALIFRKPELSLRMLASMSIHLRLLVGQIDDLRLKSVETRLANWLIRRCPEVDSNDPVTINLGVTKRVLAAEIGTVAETLSRTFAKMRDEGLLEIDGKNVTICSPVKLAALLREHLGE